MRQDKDRSAKWMVTHHGDALLTLAGLTGFSSWKPVQSEVVAPRRLPDGLLEVRFPGAAQPTLVLVEIETYPDADVAQQVFDDVMLVSVDRRVVPEVVSLVLKPKGNLTAANTVTRHSPQGGTTITGAWKVVRLWELEAEVLLREDNAGLVPWVPLARTTRSPTDLMTECRDRLAQVADPTDRAGLMAVTQILAGLAFPDKRFLDLFGGPQAMIESPVLDEVKELLRKQYEAEGARKALRDAVVANLEARFGSVPPDRVMALASISDEMRLKALHRLAITCPDLDAFAAGLATEN